MLIIVSWLVGYSFIQAVDLFSQASRTAVSFPELARGMNVLDGIFVPTFGAYYLSESLLLPFVAIRLIGLDKQSGALKLLLQLPLSPLSLYGDDSMKRKCIIMTAMVLSLSLLSFFIYCRKFMPAKAPVRLEYLPASQTQNLGIVSTAMAAETGRTTKKAVTGAADVILFDFSGETVGAPPKTFAAAVGNWVIGKDGENTILVVDGRKWKQGVASAGLADKARALYGNRYAEFLDNVTAYAYFPFAVAGKVENFTNGKIKVRFKSIAGRIDQGAGILFDLKPNGDYYALRANPLENNLVLWRYKHGRRSSVSWVRNVNTPSRQWYVLELTVDGNQIKGYVNDRQYLAVQLPAPVSGKVGLWTKADSVIYFDDYQVMAR